MATHVRVQLTDDHKGENVSVQQVPQDRLVPRFHANHSSHQVNQGDGLEAIITGSINPFTPKQAPPLSADDALLHFISHLCYNRLSKNLYNHEITHIPSNQAVCLHRFHIDGLRNPNESFNCFNVTVNSSDSYTQSL